MKLLLIFLISILIQSGKVNDLAAIELDLSKITGKSRIEIQNVLGKPLKTESFIPPGEQCSCQRAYYADNKIAITFIDNKSDWIWVYKGIELANINSARFTAFHRFDSFIFIRVKTIDDHLCCPIF